MLKNKKLRYFIIAIIIILIGIIIFFAIKKPNKDIEERPEVTPNDVPVKQEDLTIKEDLKLPLNSPIPTIKDLTNQDLEGKIEIYFDYELYEEDTLTKIGVYNIELIIEDQTYTTSITVVDEEKPTLTLKELTITEGQTYTINSFITKCSDNSNEACSYNYTKEEMAKYTKTGTYDIIIEAKDPSNNATTATTKLIIKAKPTTTDTSKKSEAKPSTETKPSTENKTPETKPNTESKTTTEDKETVTYKYGVKITTIETITYNVEADGTKTEIKRQTKKTTYDNSTYKATTAELKSEAQANSNTYASKINEILQYVNSYRSEVDAEDLVLDNNLTLAANIRALELAWSGKIEHARPNSSDPQSCFTVLSDLGIRNNYFTLGENIAAYFTTPKAVSEGWRQSSGHYKNMINQDFHKIGIGVAYLNGQYYWVQMFGN